MPLAVLSVLSAAPAEGWALIRISQLRRQMACSKIIIISRLTARGVSLYILSSYITYHCTST